MGVPKALMAIGGRAWWQVQAGRLTDAGVEAIWVVSPEVQEAMSTTSLRCESADPDAPMFESVRVGLRAATAFAPGGVFILPIDVPAAEPATWRALAATHDVAAPRHAATAPGTGGGHPLHLPWAIAAEVILPAPPGARLDRLVAGRIRVVGVEDAAVHVNLNTPADVAAWAATHA